MKQRVVVVTGLTASGKSDLSLKIAKQYGCEIINADSAQVYKDIPVITAQPEASVSKQVGHHLYGFLELSDPYSVDTWLTNCKAKIDEVCFQKKKIPIICGGTGLYINSLIHGIDEMPKTDPKVLAKLSQKSMSQLLSDYQKISKNGTVAKLDKQRLLRALAVYEQTGKTIESFKTKTNSNKEHPDYDFKIFVFIPPRDKIRKKIADRCLKMVEQGGLLEAKKVYAKIESSKLTYQDIKIIGLVELIGFLSGKTKLDEAINLMQIKTQQYAKRQSTWFRLQIDYNSRASQITEFANSEESYDLVKNELDLFLD